MIALSIVLVNWNGRAHVGDCLRSLDADRTDEVEILVVDNASTDGSDGEIEADFPWVRLIRRPDNGGFARGCNAGIEASRGAWVMLLNNDTTVEPGFCAAMLAAAREAPADVGMLQAVMLFENRPGVVNSLGIALTTHGSGVDLGEGQDRSVARDGAEIFCPTGGAAAYRRSLLDRIRLASGYLDSNYFLYYEDFDLGWRGRLAGSRARLVAKAVVHHRYHASTDRVDARALRVMVQRNRVATLLKNASRRYVARSLPDVAWSALQTGRRAGAAKVASALVEGVRVGLAQRREVGKMAAESRRAVERAWAGRRGVPG